VVGGKNVANVLGSTKEAIEASIGATVLTPYVTSESSGVARISPRSPICRSSPVVVVMARKAWYQSKPRTRGRFATSACDPLQRGLWRRGWDSNTNDVSRCSQDPCLHSGTPPKLTNQALVVVFRPRDGWCTLSLVSTLLRTPPRQYWVQRERPHPRCISDSLLRVMSTAVSNSQATCRKAAPARTGTARPCSSR
jgi:hypothetical protein